MTETDYEAVANRARHLALAERLQLIQELLATISTELTVPAAKRSILELQGIGRDMWRAIDADEYISSERSSWVR